MGYLNGTRLPNWFWIAIGFLGMGFTVATTIATKADLATQAAIYERRDIQRNEMLMRDISNLDAKVERRTNRINEELGYIGQVTRYVARKVE